MSALMICQSAIVYFLEYLQVELLGKSRLFTFYAVCLVLQRLTIVILSIDQIAIIKLQLNYKTVMTRTRLLGMVLAAYLIGIELAVLRSAWSDYDRAYLVTSVNVLMVDLAFIVMAFTTFIHFKLWKRRRRSCGKNDAFKATLFILSAQVFLSIVPDIIGIGAAPQFRKKHISIWQAITHVTEGVSAVLDPLLYIILIKTNRRTTRRMLKKVKLRNKVDIATHSQSGTVNSSTK